MPMIVTKHWETVHKWDSNHWESKEEWTNQKMMDELEALDNFRVQNFPSISLKELVKMIQEYGGIRKGTTDFLFTELKDVFESWEHYTKNCINFGRVWLAQDESYLACLIDEDRKTGGYGDVCTKHQCQDYKPMIDGKPLEELIKNIKVQFT